MQGQSKYDSNLFCVTVLLASLGLIMVFSASQVIAREHFSSSFFFMQRHAVRLALGLCFLLIFMKLPFTIYKRLSLWILAAAFLLLSAIFIFGQETRGGNRWLPLFNFMLQPVEIAKFALVIFVAAKVSEAPAKIKDLKAGFLPLLGVGVAMAVMVAFQPNLSNAVLIVFLTLVLIFVAGGRLIHLISFGAVLTAIAIPVLLRFDHVRNRFAQYFDGISDIHGRGWQVKQSLIAIGSGFITGCGPGRGHQKYNFLPDAHTDFIYSIIGEEFGLIGTLSVLILFAILFRRALRTARRSPNSFGYLLAVGIGLVIFSTAIINMSMTLGLLPVAGLPLPLVSYGGSSLVTSMSAVGILLAISSKGADPSDSKTRKWGKKSGKRHYARRVLTAGSGGREERA